MKDKVSREDERRPPALAQKSLSSRVEQQALGLSIFCHVNEREANLASREMKNA